MTPQPVSALRLMTTLRNPADLDNNPVPASLDNSSMPAALPTTCHIARSEALLGRVSEAEHHRLFGVVHEGGQGMLTTSDNEHCCSWSIVHRRTVVTLVTVTCQT